MSFNKLESCLACGSIYLTELLSLGSQPLANSFQTEPGNAESYPLGINYCDVCSHVQLSHVVDPDLLFKNYLYVSGTSHTQLEYFEWFARMVYENNYKKPNQHPKFVLAQHNILDIGCNDGSQLDEFKKLGYNTFGVDPAENLYPLSSINHKVECGYFNRYTHIFDRRFYDFIKRNTGSLVYFDVITCQNAFAHNNDPLLFLRNAKERLHPESGKMYLTTSQSNMILNGEFDTIYHEHISFYNIRSMKSLCDRAGLELFDVIKHPIHGESYIFVIAPRGHGRAAHVQNLIDMEENSGLYEPALYQQYARNCKMLIKDIEQVLASYKKNGYSVIGYGAAAKGSTLINACNLHDKIDCVIDDNPLKQGLYMPGTAIKIFSVDHLKTLTNEKKLFVPLAWNFFDEISSNIINAHPSGESIELMRYFPEIKTEVQVCQS
jgi:SAM-dependent methyltransferase